MRSVFSGVIDPKPNLSCENESFLIGLINQTYKSVEDRITHDKVVIFLKTFRYFFFCFNFEPFPQNFVANLKKFVMGHAILTKFIGLVNKSLRMIYFFKKTLIFAI